MDGKKGGGRRERRVGVKERQRVLILLSFFFPFFGCSDKRVMTCKLLSYFFVLGKERWFSSGGTVPHGDFVVLVTFL